jgi:hypothetical protein
MCHSYQLTEAEAVHSEHAPLKAGLGFCQSTTQIVAIRGQGTEVVHLEHTLLEAGATK